MAKAITEQTLLTAKSYEKKGEMDKARALYSTVLESFPNNKRAQQALRRLDPSKYVIALKETNPSHDEMYALSLLYSQGQLNEALKTVHNLILKYPGSFLLWNTFAAINKGLGKVEKAEEGFRKAIELNYNYPPAHNNIGVILNEQGKFDTAIEAYQVAIKINPNYFDAYNNLGNAFKGQGKPLEAIEAYRRALHLNPDSATANNNLGVVLQEQGQLEAAIAAYQRAIAVKPDYSDAYNNIGVALIAKGKLDSAIEACQKALEIKPDYAEAHNTMGVALQEQGKFDAALRSYYRALEIKADYADAYNNIGNVFKIQCKLDAAIQAYRSALAINFDHSSAHNNMGTVLFQQGKIDDAIVAYQRAITIKPAYTDAYTNMGVALEDQAKLDLAIEAYLSALMINPGFYAVEVQLIHVLFKVCDWSRVKQLSAPCERSGLAAKLAPPFSMLSVEDNPERQLIRSRNWVKESYKQQPLPFPEKPKVRPKRLKIGYFSADFHDHATLYLMSGLLKSHDTSKFEIFAYSYGRSKTGDLRQKLEGSIEHFYDLTDDSDSSIVELCRSHGLDIAIDLKGYTGSNRSAIFQYRLAPIQVNYLGYPGSMGAEFIDYIIADCTIIPENLRNYYSEKVIYLPHSYQPNDNTREISDVRTTRADFGLPGHAFVFCCFNNSYKISEREFDIWMRILSQIDGSVLWLLKSNKWAEQNLRKEAEARGISASRLIFADKLPQKEHLARHQHADLFIDTFNVNAHTTASDALWAGIPVITKIGNQFAARVAASLLHAVGLPDLITATEVEYEALIIDLATNPEKLKALREKLAKNRLKEPLFDTSQYTQHYEWALQEAYDVYYNAGPPQDIWLKVV
jgi:protein O-GlcNAc transferase